MDKSVEILISDEEINRRLDQIEQVEMSDDLRAYLIRALEVLVELDRLVGLQETTIARLRKIFGKKTERRPSTKGTPSGTGGTPPDAGGKGKGKGKAPGHGRNGVDQYQNIPEEHYAVTEFSAGDPCPKEDTGKLYPYTSRVHIRITGGAPFRATKITHETLRCNVCGLIIEAKSHATGKPKYDTTVVSILAILHYGQSIPLYRLEKLQKTLYVPMPRSVQWSLLLQLGLSVVVVWETLLNLLSNAREIMIDDTGVKILSLMGKETEKGERKKLSTTGMRALVDTHEIVLYKSGKNNSGENLDELITARDSKDDLIVMSDASTTNLPRKTKMDFALHLLNCLTHARRKFVDVEKKYQEEAEKVKDLIGKVYHNESLSKEKGLNPSERLKWHQEQSAPIMAELKTWCENAFKEKLVEPNSALGNGIKYVLKHWIGLTGFLHIEGASLDTNMLELHLRNPVINRKNWLFYKTETGAFIGDVLLSLIKTCERAGENPFEYLNALQVYEREVRAGPENWLPWNYKKNLPSVP